MRKYAARAWDPNASAVHPSTLRGGVYVNFRNNWNGSGSAAANTNIGTDGVSDTGRGAPSRHDPLNDLLILRDIDALESAGYQDPVLDRLRCHLQPVTAAEFPDYGPPRGWVYDQLSDLARLDTNGPWAADAHRFAASLAMRYAKDLEGTRLRPDWLAQSAAALLSAGRAEHNPSWVSLGTALARRVCMDIADPRTGLFPGQVSISSSGQVRVDDALAKVGVQAQLLDALLRIGEVTHDAIVLGTVRTGLGTLLSRSVGVMDPVHGGWFYALNFDGKGVRRSYKETRQAWLVPLFQDAVAAHLLRSEITDHMLATVRDNLYLSSAGGYVYRVRPDWAAFSSSRDDRVVREDWISSEATGIAVSALLGPLR